MAEVKKTRIVLRNGATEAWNTVADTVILLKGEVGIEFDPSAEAAHKVRMKIGDGKSTWTNLEYFGEAEAQRFAKTYQVDIAAGADKLAAITTAVGSDELKAGDIAVVREAIHGDEQKQYTAFVYNGTAWMAMDGNYNAENVYFADDFTYTAAIGVLAKPASGNATLAAAGKNVKEVLASILAKRVAPTATQPAASVTLAQAGAKEAGTKITPSYTASLTAGSYTYGPATGITATSYSVTDGVAGHTAQTTATGSFPEIQVTDGMNYKLSVTIAHGAGAVPKDNLGDASPAQQIAAGNKTANSSAVTAYRNSFYGSLTDKTGALTSAVIRGLKGKSGRTLAAGNTFKAEEAVGAMRVVIAVPAPRTCTSIKDENGLNAEALSAFTKITVSVEGANGYEAKEYNVYYKDNADACNKANNWVVTLG